MAPRETENNAYAKFEVTNKEHYGMLCYFLEWSISNLVLGVGQSFLCRREGVGHVFYNNHISKCSGPRSPPPPLYFLTSPLSDADENLIT